MLLKNYILNKWVEGNGSSEKLFNPVNSELIAEYSEGGYNLNEVFEFARNKGNKNLREMTFHERGRMLKALAQYLMSHKKELYPLSFQTGATKIDSWVDIEGGISTLYTYASKGRRELPDEKVWNEGNYEVLSPKGTFVGQHICVPLTGTALHINAYNFPVWGMLEKLAPTFIAGMSAVVKPAPVSSHLAVKLVELINESNLLPEGALQLILGQPKNLFDELTPQDVLTFTGSAETANKIKANPNLINNSIRMNIETDSLNCSVMGTDVKEDSEEFKLFVKEVVIEMTTKAGQKCTAIRRTIVPTEMMNVTIKAISERLDRVVVGDPNNETTRMGSLADKRYLQIVNDKVKTLKETLETVYDKNDSTSENDNAFISPVLLKSANPFENKTVHEIEAFGPVNTIMPYNNFDEAIELAKMGEGSLVASLFTYDNTLAKEFVIGAGSYHGRIAIINRDCAKESTGHGSPLPHLTHGGPGRAGGGEEMGGIRGILKYMQRIAVQGHPKTLTDVSSSFVKGAENINDDKHPFKKYFEELVIGETFITHRRTVTETDVVNFAGISGDFFYAHMDEVAVKNSIFERRVAHGYFVLSAAAGLFVYPGEGPVLANYGLDNLRFTQPVYVGDTIHVRITCRVKTKKEKREETDIPQGVVEWFVEVINQDNEIVAVYTILTLVKRKSFD